MAEYSKQQCEPKGSLVELYYFFTVRRKLANNQNSLTKDVKFTFLNKEFAINTEYFYHISFKYK